MFYGILGNMAARFMAAKYRFTGYHFGKVNKKENNKLRGKGWDRCKYNKLRDLLTVVESYSISGVKTVGYL